LSEKIIGEDLSQVEESATKSTYRLGVGFEICEDKSEKSVPKFISSSTYHKEEETIKFTKTHYPSNPKSSFNPKKYMKKETPKSREEVFVYMFCGHAGHLDEFCFRRKTIEKRRLDYARNSYRDELINFLSRSYSRVPPRSYSHILPRTYSHDLPYFSHGSNHRSYDFGSQENNFVPRRFRCDPCPHHDDRFPRRPGFPTGGFHTRFEPRHLNGPHFPRSGSCPTCSNGDV
jgi:hypothetical protein